MSNIVDRMKDKHNNTNLSMNTDINIAELELTGACELNCRFCYNRILKQKGIRQNYVDEDGVKIFLSTIKKMPSIKEVGLYGLGESTLHPHLAKYYKMMKEAGYFTYLTTNGVKIAHLIPAIKYIDSLKFSWNYKDENDFHAKTGADHKTMYTILSNINNIYQLFSNITDISISVVLDIGDQVSDFKYMLSKIKCKNVFFVPVLTQGGIYGAGKTGGPNIVEDGFKKSMPCWTLFKGLYVDCNLNVRTCPYGNNDSKQYTHILGNLKKDSLEDILKERDKYKQMHLNGDCPIICKKCLKDQEEGD